MVEPPTHGLALWASEYAEGHIGFSVTIPVDRVEEA